MAILRMSSCGWIPLYESRQRNLAGGCTAPTKRAVAPARDPTDRREIFEPAYPLIEGITMNEKTVASPTMVGLRSVVFRTQKLQSFSASVMLKGQSLSSVCRPKSQPRSTVDPQRKPSSFLAFCCLRYLANRSFFEHPTNCVASNRNVSASTRTVRIRAKETGHENACSSRSGNSVVNRHHHHRSVRGRRRASAHVLPQLLSSATTSSIVRARWFS
jgi:hypothetical protein